VLKDYKNTPEEDAASEAQGVEPGLSLSQTFKMLFSKTAYIILLIYFCVLGMVNWLVNGWLPTFLKEHFNLNLGEAGMSATGYIQIGSFIGVVLGGIWADRWARSNVKGRVYVVIIGFSIGAPVLFLMSATSVFGIAILAMMVFGLARGFNDANLMPIMRQIVDGRYAATAYGFLNFLSTIVGGIMVYVGGALKDADIGLAIVYQVCAVIMILATFTLFALKLKRQ
jgi:MFS family permease